MSTEICHNPYCMRPINPQDAHYLASMQDKVIQPFCDLMCKIQSDTYWRKMSGEELKVARIDFNHRLAVKKRNRSILNDYDEYCQNLTPPTE